MDTRYLLFYSAFLILLSVAVTNLDLTEVTENVNINVPTDLSPTGWDITNIVSRFTFLFTFGWNIPELAFVNTLLLIFMIPIAYEFTKDILIPVIRVIAEALPL